MIAKASREAKQLGKGFTTMQAEGDTKTRQGASRHKAAMLRQGRNKVGTNKMSATKAAQGKH